ncbi:major capsid protein [Vibrio phage 1.055.O._10N.286.55.E9]|nr:major capsid protein [Vibrio phage 1.055.O._10N.286.55.E9]
MVKPNVRKATTSMTTQRANVSVRPDSLNTDERTVEVVFTTGQSGKRWDWDIGYYLEELAVTPDAVRSERLDKGLSVIGDHRAYDIRNVFGVTEDWRIEGDELIGTVRFASDAESDVIFTKVKDKVLRHFSLGYNVYTFEATVNPDSNGLDTYRAIDWEPTELSIVPVSFETNNGIRSEKPSDSSLLHDVNIIGDDTMKFRNQNLKYHTPDDGNGNQLGGGQEPTVEPVTPVVASERTVEPAPAPVVVTAPDTRAHLGLMRTAATNAGLPVDFALDAFERGVEPTQFNLDVLAELGKRSTAAAPKQMLAGERNDYKEGERAAIETALLVRAGIGQHTDASRAFATGRMIDIANHLNSKQGENVMGMSSMAQAGRAFQSTSDFPLILENIMNKTMQAGYNETPRTFESLGLRTTVNDFRAKNAYSLGDAPNLLPLGENGEYKSGTIGEAKEAYAIETFARKIGFSRKMLINDDMNALSTVPRMFGMSGSRLESDTVWGLLLNYNFRLNKAADHKMSDGKHLFDAAHKNVLTGAGSALSKTSLGDMRKLGRKMKTLDGNFMNIMWDSLVVPEELETTAEDLLINSLIANQNANINSFQGKYSFAIEPRLAVVSDTAWYAFTSMLNSFEYAYLAGEEGMMTEVNTSTDVDGLEILVRKDFGAGLVESRGAARSAGK